LPAFQNERSKPAPLQFFPDLSDSLQEIVSARNWRKWKVDTKYSQPGINASSAEIDNREFTQQVWNVLKRGSPAQFGELNLDSYRSPLEIMTACSGAVFVAN
jgi:hypothetical protein